MTLQEKAQQNRMGKNGAKELTLDVQVDRVADPVALDVVSHTSVDTGLFPLHVLQGEITHSALGLLILSGNKPYGHP